MRNVKVEIDFAEFKFVRCDCPEVEMNHGYLCFNDEVDGRLPIMIPSTTFGAALLMEFNCGPIDLLRLIREMLSGNLPLTYIDDDMDRGVAEVEAAEFTKKVRVVVLKKLEQHQLEESMRDAFG